jgi:type I restriction enzyme, R subunit
MRQAIEEGFILDVLQNYITYKSYWNLFKTIKDDPKYDKKKATRLLINYVELNDHAIKNKVEIIVQHFVDQVADQINGKAKAMIVTRSRLHAVRYKLALDRYLIDHGIPYKALVAFSGKVDDAGTEYSETQMNTFPETKTAEYFKQDEYRFLIVAEKFQTGFDQPLLYAMYVDKRLVGLHAVQTLSRLNRVYPGKKETFVLDFANEADDIQKAFEPYYEKTFLNESTDPNLLYDLENRIEEFHYFSNKDLDKFAKVYFSSKGTQDKLNNILRPVVDRYDSAEEKDQVVFRAAVNDFVRLYSFISQILSFADPNLEKLYVFSRLLARRIHPDKEVLPKEITESIDLGSYRIKKTSAEKIELKRGQGEIQPETPISNPKVDKDLEALSEIIQELNERFGTEFTDEDRPVLEQLEQHLANSEVLKQAVKVNPPESSILTFKEVLKDQLTDLVDTQFKFYKQVNDNPDFAQTLTTFLFERYLKANSSKVVDKK